MCFVYCWCADFFILCSRIDELDSQAQFFDFLAFLTGHFDLGGTFVQSIHGRGGAASPQHTIHLIHSENHALSESTEWYIYSQEGGLQPPSCSPRLPRWHFCNPKRQPSAARCPPDRCPPTACRRQVSPDRCPPFNKKGFFFCLWGVPRGGTPWGVP